MALVNCLNFGNPEHPEVMWQLSEAIDGIAEACAAFDLPVIGGNVSLYNESRGADIDPTPIVAVLGLIDDLRVPPPGVTLCDAGTLLLLGTTEPNLGGSRWAAECRQHTGGRLPALDLAFHRSLVALVAELVNDGILVGLHDVGDGGLGVALAELAVHAALGMQVTGVSDHAELFAESPSRVVVCVPDDETGRTVGARAAAAGVVVTELGRVGGDRFVIDGLVDLDVAAMIEAWRMAIPAALVP
ncbi:MAG: hypothetical protein NVSMB4_11380 [Acidimicrobiales bacterium]